MVTEEGTRARTDDRWVMVMVSGQTAVFGLSGKTGVGNGDGVRSDDRVWTVREDRDGNGYGRAAGLS